MRISRTSKSHPAWPGPLGDPSLQGYEILQKIFFAPTQTSQAAGAAFSDRLMRRGEDREPVSGPAIAQAQMEAFCEWDQFIGERFADLKSIRHPILVVNGVHDEMIPVRNSYWLGEKLPNAVLLTHPDSATAPCSSSKSRSRAKAPPSLNPGRPSLLTERKVSRIPDKQLTEVPALAPSAPAMPAIEVVLPATSRPVSALI